MVCSSDMGVPCRKGTGLDSFKLWKEKLKKAKGKRFVFCSFCLFFGKSREGTGDPKKRAPEEGQKKTVVLPR